MGDQKGPSRVPSRAKGVQTGALRCVAGVGMCALLKMQGGGAVRSISRARERHMPGA
jgi:hypothetical protein